MVWWLYRARWSEGLIELTGLTGLAVQIAGQSNLSRFEGILQEEELYAGDCKQVDLEWWWCRSWCVG